MLICLAVQHEGQATGEEPLCVSVALLIETDLSEKTQTVADSS